MAAMATLALSGPDVRSSASAEPGLLRRIEEQRGRSLSGLPDQVVLSPGGAADLRGPWEQPTEILPGTHRSWVFSEPDGCCLKARKLHLTRWPTVLSHHFPVLHAHINEDRSW